MWELDSQNSGIGSEECKLEAVTLASRSSLSASVLPHFWHRLWSDTPPTCQKDYVLGSATWVHACRWVTVSLKGRARAVLSWSLYELLALPKSWRWKTRVGRKDRITLGKFQHSMYVHCLLMLDIHVQFFNLTTVIQYRKYQETMGNVNKIQSFNETNRRALAQVTQILMTRKIFFFWYSELCPVMSGRKLWISRDDISAYLCILLISLKGVVMEE